MTITPRIAEQMLEGNKSNRPLLMKHVMFLAKQMRNGDWKHNGESIKFNGTTLLDGQHRLMACIKADAPFTTLVVRGIDSDVFDTIDTGKMRSAADALAMSGFGNTRMIAGAVRAIYSIRHSKVDAHARLMTNAEVLLFAQSNPRIADSAVYVNQHKKAKAMLAASPACALHFEFSIRNKAKCEEFFDGLESGVNLDPSSPIYMLREKLLANQMNKAKFSQSTVMAYSIKSFNALCIGAPMKRLSWHVGKGEQFPQLD